MGLNAGGAEVHLSCKNIQPGHVKPAVCWQNSRKILVNWKLCCGEDSPGKRKPGGIFSVLADIQQLLLHCLASGWRNNPRHPIIYSYLIPYVLLQVYYGRFPVHRCQQYSIKGVL